MLSKEYTASLYSAPAPGTVPDSSQAQVVLDPRARRLPKPVSLPPWHQMHGSVDTIIEADIEAVGHQAGEQASSNFGYEGADVLARHNKHVPVPGT